MDIYHTGKEDATDDHKLVNERLLEVAIPGPSANDMPIKLEECLETYFNNRIEVKRHLERRNTLNSGKSPEKMQALSIESTELSSPSTPTTPAMDVTPTLPSVSVRPTGLRKRAESIFSERYVEVADGRASDAAPILSEGPRKTTLRKEVLMPAWQFFSLIRKYMILPA
jgi:hypothetical protein